MESANLKTCGDHGGRKRDGSPCQRVAGWGTDETTGQCSFHRLGAPARSVKFDTLKKEKYLELLAAGGRRYASAQAVGVCYETIRNYRIDNPDYDKLVSLAEMQANDMVEDALFQQALKGNVTACLAWLYSRCPDRWQDRRNIRHAVETDDRFPGMTPSERLARVLGINEDQLPD